MIFIVVLVYIQLFCNFANKFAIIDCDCARKKKLFICLFAKLSQSSTPTVLSPTEKNGRVGQDIWKGVYYALVLTPWNLAVSKMNVKKQSNVNAPWVCYIHTSNTVQPLVYPYPMATIGIEVVLYISAWGLCVARLWHSGFARASRSEASDSAGLHAFFVSWFYHLTTNMRYL